ncbi:alpha/beta fold hydrolase [Halobellus limi]|uniref:Alpha/beta hydrolase n=1 Tax=Halobellus limi TaxID=699433 RepID=A0A1H6CFG8_9EURY|nr:alpha/beta hydrolase [Halobellus limi]QCC49540.1 alpha/beta hydrolase [Halobellus limi]SEG71638.1 Pimeloyl-ACP methyl ester carboxylesterase [Halobellus limi]
MSEPDDPSDSSFPGTVSVEGPVDAVTVVFVHGAGISKHMWRPQVEALSEDFRVVTFDLPGHGTQNDTGFDFDSAVEWVADIVADVRPSSVVLVGHSLGGYVALECAARIPHQVSELVLSGSSAEYRGWLGFRTRVIAALYRLGGRIPFVDRRFHARTADQIRRLPIADTTAQAIIDGGFYLHSWGEAGRALVGRDFQSRLQQYDGPVLLVNGEEDTLNVPNAEQFSSELSNVESAVIADVGHLCNLQAPSTYTDHIRDFSRGH